MNEENEWDHRISAEVKEGPADSIRIGEAAAALKKMKRHKAPGLSGLSAEIMIHATKGIGTQWLLWLPYGIRRPQQGGHNNRSSASMLLLSCARPVVDG